MKIQERTGAGAGRTGAPAQPSVGDRLPTPPRERKPALAALAVLLILVGALGATTLVLQAGDRVEVVKVTKAIPAGGSVTDANTTSVLVADDSGVAYVPWAQLGALKKLKALNPIPAGVIPVGQMFGESAGVAEGKATVGLSLKAGQYPNGLEKGDSVAAYRVPKGGTGSNSSSTSGGSSTGSANTLLVDRAKVDWVRTEKGDELVGSTNFPITLIVDADQAAALAQAASDGDVALVRVSGN
ncbi:hypothetical protein ELQ87_16560 [Streptomyces griseoviridis]|uniref:SAF domain-containing protein n=1 Tax=Streptomyces griseoviridis TaxID=45398 RepID=A0A3Q9KWH2_STRGD|nr:hypothetical protein [Streptomyces griseoviridis]AZS85734.1 hypothetical protein ELQ87_16560 [Streptomyces griseoviridis]QCN87416.1 hypothetical protein DDJ31_22720 [Streptomyces griseoviridis]